MADLTRTSKWLPRQHQINAAEFIAPLDYWALFMEQGTGKSKVCLMEAKKLYDEGKIDRMLILCPNSVKFQWATEVLEEHSELDYIAMAYDGFSTKKKKADFTNMLSDHRFKILVMHYKTFSSQSFRLYVKLFLRDHEALIIADESTKIKNPEAKRTETIMKGFRKRKYKGILSGTPTPNSPLDLWSQFEFLCPGFWGMDYFVFKKRYCILLRKNDTHLNRIYYATLDEDTWWKAKARLQAAVRDFNETNVEKRTSPTVDMFDDVGHPLGISVKDMMVIWNQEKYSAYKHLDEIWEKIAPYTFTVTKDECMDLPPKIYEKLECELSAEQKRVMRQLKNDMMATLDGSILTTENTISNLMRMQCITGGMFPYQEIDTRIDGSFDLKTKYKRMKDNPKMVALLDDLETVSADTSILIWAIFTEELKWIYEEVSKAGYSCGLYIGATPQKQREQLEKDFKAKKFQILVINPMLGEMGLNFQVATLHYIYSNGYEADRRLQLEDRSHRMGQVNKVTYKDLVCRNSPDIRILLALKRKEDLISYFRKKPIKDWDKE